MTHDTLDREDVISLEARRCAADYAVSPEIHPADHIFRFVSQEASDPTDAVRDFFNGGADAAVWLKKMIGLCRPTDRPFSLLEFAAGYGRVTRHLPNVIPKAVVTASDIHPAAVTFAEKLGMRGLLSSSDPDRFDAEGGFDIIFALSFFTHMPKSTWGRWLRTLVRHLDPDGYLIFTTHGVPGMRIMGTASGETLPWDEDGFWFAPMSEQKDIDAAEYGSTGTSFRFVQDEILASGASLFHFQERGAGYQDVYIVRPRDRLDEVPRATDLAHRPRRAAPRSAPALDDCLFHHTMELPLVGTVQGQWDLRGLEDDCLGNVDLAGRSVLEIGPASGYLTFWMEQQGAEVTAFDLDESRPWDLVPFAHAATDRARRERGDIVRRLNNAWWYTREALGSSARCFYGTVYDLDASVGMFDVVTISSVLLHLRDPMLAIERAAARTRDQIVVTEVSERHFAADKPQLTNKPTLHFIPRAGAGGPIDSWWHIPSALLREFLQILGFRTIEVFNFRATLNDGHDWQFYTIVGTR